MEPKHRISRLFKKKSRDEHVGSSNHSSPPSSPRRSTASATSPRPTTSTTPGRPTTSGTPDRNVTGGTPGRSAASGEHHDHNIAQGRSRYSEDVADRNLGIVPAQEEGQLPRTKRSKDVLDHAQPDFPKVAVEKSSYSEDVADRNVGGLSRSHDHGSTSSDLGKLKGQDTQAALQYMSRNEGATSPTPQSNETLRQDGSARDLEPALASLQLSDGNGQSNIRTSNEASATTFPPRSSSIDKTRTRKPIDGQAKAEAAGLSAETLGKLKAAGIDLNDSADTEVNTTYAPAVTHETIMPVVKEIRQEVITREIHNHHIIHRILPIKDVEVLPAKHFIRLSNGDLREIAAPAIARENYVANDLVQYEK